MTGIDYDRLRDGLVHGLIDRFGTSAVLRHGSAATYDPVRGVTQPSLSEHTVRAVLLSNESAAGGALDTTLTRRALVSAKGLLVTPAPGDELIVDARVMRVTAVLSPAPGGIALFHQLDITV